VDSRSVLPIESAFVRPDPFDVVELTVVLSTPMVDVGHRVETGVSVRYSSSGTVLNPSDISSLTTAHWNQLTAGSRPLPLSRIYSSIFNTLFLLRANTYYVIG
jgi:hypothetical protein